MQARRQPYKCKNKPVFEQVGLVLKRDLLIAAAIALLTALVFSQVVNFGFLKGDDQVLITDNPNVQQGLGLSGLKWAFFGTGKDASANVFDLFHGGIWMPVTSLTHLTDVSLYGNNPVGHHFTSLVFHVLTAGVLYLALVSLTGRPFESALAVLLFALHPLRAGVVSWVASRKELTCALFFVLALFLYARHAARPSFLRMFAVTVAGAMSMMGKPTAVTLPCVLLLLDWWPLDRLRLGKGLLWRRVTWLVLEKLPLFIIVAFVARVAIVGQKMVGAIDLTTTESRMHRLMNVPVSYVRYLWHTVFPVNLEFHYLLLGDSLTWGITVAATVFLLGIGLVSLLLWRRGYLLVSWLWFLGTLVPVIGIVGFANSSMADRYTYIPHMGLFIAVSWGLTELTAKLDRRLKTGAPSPGEKVYESPAESGSKTVPGRIAWSAAVVLVTATTLTCLWQTWYWHDMERISLRSFTVNPRNVRACALLGNIKARKGLHEEALRYLQEAARLDPTDPHAQANPARELNSMKRYAEAERLLADTAKKALMDTSPYLPPNAITKALGEVGHQTVLVTYGYSLYQLGRPKEALPFLEKARTYDPDDIETCICYALCEAALGERAKARVTLKKLLLKNPDNSEVKETLDSLQGGG